MGPVRQEKKIVDRKKIQKIKIQKKNEARRAKSNREGGGQEQWRESRGSLAFLAQTVVAQTVA
jgi:hypothetical protein